MTDKTPMQELLDYIGNKELKPLADVIRKEFIPKEQEFAGKVWDASDKRKRYLEKLERGLIVLVGDDEKFPDKDQFISKYYKS